MKFEYYLPLLVVVLHETGPLTGSLISPSSGAEALFKEGSSDELALGYGSRDSKLAVHRCMMWAHINRITAEGCRSSGKRSVTSDIQ